MCAIAYIHTHISKLYCAKRLHHSRDACIEIGVVEKRVGLEGTRSTTPAVAGRSLACPTDAPQAIALIDAIIDGGGGMGSRGTVSAEHPLLIAHRPRSASVVGLVGVEARVEICVVDAGGGGTKWLLDAPTLTGALLPRSSKVTKGGRACAETIIVRCGVVWTSRSSAKELDVGRIEGALGTRSGCGGAVDLFWGGGTDAKQQGEAQHDGGKEFVHSGGGVYLQGTAKTVLDSLSCYYGQFLAAGQALRWSLKLGIIYGMSNKRQHPPANASV